MPECAGMSLEDLHASGRTNGVDGNERMLGVAGEMTMSPRTEPSPGRGNVACGDLQGHEDLGYEADVPFCCRV